ncbi:inositol-3-phosphate synthase [Sulfurisphaera ohwakuensis]|uniref:Myo-inositol-1-phosphate synthase n=1 Tax=Sulfurisphaera ohwakuensis TaxID=69656 RepID=A0A650CJ86_SULOH|nr:L-myo-inositol-1-phosphate synthase [Sulfurisphaera ohwakuensis]MBB5253971.1 myo-inositol-1-phosphate synthase [Sulfurisphaera ohwakuensis]QGR17856.1 L-myo-inositol-1-phosphate synthase [Sulfurisphaera ohwakuensis]
MIKVAIFGVGNVASALLQGLEWLKEGKNLPGLLDLSISPTEIEIVKAFDIDKRKVGKKISEAIFMKPNVVKKYVDVKLDIIVERGPTLDGLEGSLSNIIEESEEKPVDVESELKDVDVSISLLPAGTQQANEYYASASLNANVAFINATPAEIINIYAPKFAEKKIPIFGDDLLSQIGGTILHTGIIEFLKSRGVKVIRTYQIDISGNTETYVTLEEWRKDLKKGIKSNFISSHADDAQVIAGTSDYVEFLGDRRVSYMSIEGIYSFGVPFKLDISFKTEDAPNAVVPLIDLIRLAKIAKDNGIGGAIPQICGYYFKRPPKIYSSLEEAKHELLNFVKMMTEPRLDR